MIIPSPRQGWGRLGFLVLLVSLGAPGSLGPDFADEPTAPAAVPDASVFCTVCGARNKAGSRFCLKDGAPLPTLEVRRTSRNFTRAPETFSPEEIQAAIHQAARSVVRIRIKVNASLRYPETDDDNDGYLEVVKDEEKFVGSGFVIDEPGSVVTNAHVAMPDGMTGQITVDTTEGQSFPAKLVGVDEASDLAVLKIEGSPLAALTWGDSESVQLGEETWTLGNPLDIGLSLTRGTISSVVRMRIGMNQVENFLHSDAFFTHGNSGGPLVSTQGLVLGVSDIGYGVKGQGYSIPSRMAHLVVQRIRAEGAYRRGFVGVHVHPVDAESMRKFSIKRSRGVVVESVMSGTPAEAAGLRPGDLIFGVNGRAAADTYLLQEAISSVGPGAPLSLAVERGGTVLDIAVTTALRPRTPRIDPVRDLERYLQAEFVEDTKKGRVVLRVLNSFSIAGGYGFNDGEEVESALPAQDWTEIPLQPQVYRSLKFRNVKRLSDLREALQRMYMGGRVGVAFNLKSDRSRYLSFVEEENWAVIL